MDDLLSLYRIVLVISIIGITISTLEYWAIAGTFRPDGIYPWNILRLRPQTPFLSSISGFHDMGVRALLLLRALALLLALAAPFQSYIFSAALGFLIASMAVLRWRTGFSEDGSDRMNVVVLVTVFLCANPLSTPFTLQAGLWFIALQACLSYSTYGLAKMASDSWRSGEALYRILSTKTYGLEVIADLMEGRRTLQFFLCWSVMLLETVFPLSLVLPRPWLWLFLAWGIGFHILCAIIMGFNSFLWAFAATYPAIAYVSIQIIHGQPFSFCSYIRRLCG